MSDDRPIDNPELESLFERYRAAPGSHVFAPLADACRKAGMIEEAIEIVEKGVSRHPGYASGHVVRGKCYYDHGTMHEAEVSFDRVLELDANNLVALKYLGMIRAEEGDAAAARDHFKHILALDPENGEIKRQLDSLSSGPPPRRAETARAEGADSDDEERWREIPDEGFEGVAIQLDADDSSTTDELATVTLADIYADQGYTGRALRIYREVLRRQPDNESVRRKIAALEDAGPQGDSEVATEEAEALAAPAAEIEFDDTQFEEISGERVARRAQESKPADEDPSETARPASTGAVIEEQQSYEQFKRWLRNLAD